jgi:uncharacterized membrane protein
MKTHFDSLSHFDTLLQMAGFNRIFFRGLVTLLPIAITIYVIYSAIIILDNLLGSILRLLLPQSIYFPGLGLLLILVLIYFFGLLLNNFMTGRLFAIIEKKFTEVPFIKAIYSPLRDLMNLFSKSGKNKLSNVVLVKLGESNSQALGLVTRENFQDLNLKGSAEGKIAVYFPLSYGLGGFTFLIPRSQVTEIDMPVEKAMRLAITGWVKTENVDGNNS